MLSKLTTSRTGVSFWKLEPFKTDSKFGGWCGTSPPRGVSLSPEIAPTVITCCKTAHYGATVGGKPYKELFVRTCNGSRQRWSTEFSNQSRGRRSTIIDINEIVPWFSFKPEEYEFQVCVRGQSPLAIHIVAVKPISVWKYDATCTGSSDQKIWARTSCGHRQQCRIMNIKEHLESCH